MSLALSKRGKKMQLRLASYAFLVVLVRFVLRARIFSSSIYLCMTVARDFLQQDGKGTDRSISTFLAKVVVLTELVDIAEYIKGVFKPTTYVNYYRTLAHIAVVLFMAVPSCPFSAAYILVESAGIILTQFGLIMRTQGYKRTYYDYNMFTFFCEQALSLVICYRFLLRVEYFPIQKRYSTDTSFHFQSLNVSFDPRLFVFLHIGTGIPSKAAAVMCVW